jgi:hypothetical protein
MSSGQSSSTTSSQSTQTTTTTNDGAITGTVSAYEPASR